MKKLLLLSLTSLFLLTATGCSCSSSTNSSQPLIEFEEEWTHDDHAHWHKCKDSTLDIISGYASHSYDENGYCVCGVYDNKIRINFHLEHLTVLNNKPIYELGEVVLLQFIPDEGYSLPKQLEINKDITYSYSYITGFFSTTISETLLITAVGEVKVDNPVKYLTLTRFISDEEISSLVTNQITYSDDFKEAVYTSNDDDKLHTTQPYTSIKVDEYNNCVEYKEVNSSNQEQSNKYTYDIQNRIETNIMSRDKNVRYRKFEYDETDRVTKIYEYEDSTYSGTPIAYFDYVYTNPDENSELLEMAYYVFKETEYVVSSEFSGTVLTEYHKAENYYTKTLTTYDEDGDICDDCFEKYEITTNNRLEIKEGNTKKCYTYNKNQDVVSMKVYTNNTIDLDIEISYNEQDLSIKELRATTYYKQSVDTLTVFTFDLDEDSYVTKIVLKYYSYDDLETIIQEGVITYSYTTIPNEVPSYQNYKGYTFGNYFGIMRFFGYNQDDRTHYEVDGFHRFYIPGYSLY